MVKCINCNHAGSPKFICFEMKSNWWFREVLNVTNECEYFSPILDIGDRYDFKYPNLNNFKNEKVKTILNDSIAIDLI